MGRANKLYGKENVPRFFQLTLFHFLKIGVLIAPLQLGKKLYNAEQKGILFVPWSVAEWAIILVEPLDAVGLPIRDLELTIESCGLALLHDDILWRCDKFGKPLIY